jgi:hypothetical protein
MKILSSKLGRDLYAWYYSLEYANERLPGDTGAWSDGSYKSSSEL